MIKNYSTLIVGLLVTIISAKSTSQETTDPDDEKTAAAMIRGLRLAHSPVTVGTSDAPWISGPRQKKYQFHVGQQSWIEAREACLAENADLLTIADIEELDWILAHYKPQLRQFRERQLQIGLLASDNDDGSINKQWQWVSESPVDLNESGIEWNAGEPFDHAEGRERCALLNVNTRTLDDVDCSLSGSPSNFYRFVCERTHEKHLKHEELNNPLWKKLEDILVFFGISRPSNSSDQSETELTGTKLEDYEDVMNATAADEKIGASGEEPNNEERSVQTLNDGPPLPSTNTVVEPTVVVAHGTRISESTANDQEILADGKLDKLTSSSATPENTTMPEDFSTTSDFLKRTTASDPLANLADTIENAARDDTQKSTGDRMRNLERIINAVQTMLEEENNSQVGLDAMPLVQLRKLSASSLQNPSHRNLAAKFPFRESNEFGNEIEISGGDEQNLKATKRPNASARHAAFRSQFFSPQPNDLLKSKPKATTRDPWVIMPPEIGLMRTLGSTLFDAMTRLYDDDTEDIDDLLPIRRHLNTPTTNLNISENVEVVQLVDRRIHDDSETNLVDSGSPLEQAVTAQNLDSDHEEAQVESRAHPNTNSGDFLLARKQDELIGCGAKNLGHTRPSVTTTSAPVNRTAQVEQLVSSLRTILASSSPELISDLLSSGNDTKLLVEKLQTATVNATTKVPEDVHRAWVEDELAKSLEELGQEESREFVDAAPTDSDELVAIGSGLEPPADRLVTLIPVVLSAKQTTTNSTASDLTKSANVDGYDVNVKLLLPTVSSMLSNKKKAENEDSQFQIPTNDSSEELDEGSGSISVDAKQASVFPQPDFSVLKNEKQAAAAKKRLSVDRQKADKAFNELKKVDAKSLAERIRESEAKRQNGAAISEVDPETAKILRNVFEQWIDFVESK
ncbi:C-type lectin domain-containing protein [Aphelenchoides besseyi]|nr:C-type lectin domain-containing protein [Aphelenchoides besseyi]